MTQDQQRLLRQRIEERVSFDPGTVRIEGCGNDFAITKEFCREQGLDAEAEAAAFHTKACCDCELVLNNHLAS